MGLVLFFRKKRAENGTRTRDPNLGKVVLYQLSYFRNVLLAKVGTLSILGKVVLYQLSYFRLFFSEEEETRTPTSQLTLPPQSSASTNSATSPTLITSE